MKNLCAVEGCDREAHPQICFYDGQYHHHGCIHYGCGYPKHSVTFREEGWHWVCNYHYAILKKEREEWFKARRCDRENKKRSARSPS